MQAAALQKRDNGESLLDSIGNTPLLRMPAISSLYPGVEILGKAEFLNPGGSVKDRPGLSMILDGERSGRLTKARTILDATSGNTGIAYAMIGASLGYKVRDPVMGLVQNLKPRAVEMRLPVRGVVVLIGIKVAVGVALINFAALQNRPV